MTTDGAEKTREPVWIFFFFLIFAAGKEGSGGTAGRGGRGHCDVSQIWEMMDSQADEPPELRQCGPTRLLT